MLATESDRLLYPLNLITTDSDDHDEHEFAVDTMLITSDTVMTVCVKLANL